jgi:hypothetical protein
VRLGGTDLVNSVVICHPGSFTIDEVKAIKVPTAWVCAEGNLLDILPFYKFFFFKFFVRGYVFSRITSPGF